MSQCTHRLASVGYVLGRGILHQYPPPLWPHISTQTFFTVGADAAQWLIKQAVECVLNCLDDLFVEAPRKPATARWIAIKTLSKLSIPLAPKKVERLSTKLELDSDSMMAWLPEDKLEQLKSMVASWHNRKAYTKRELLYLVDVLQLATLVVCYGRVFLRRMIEQSNKQAKEYRQLSCGTQSDMNKSEHTHSRDDSLTQVQKN